MSKSLTDYRNEIEEAEFLAKLAHVESVWGENLEARELLADTIDALEKEAAAGAFGEQGISPSQLISLGVAYTNELLGELEGELEKEAAEVEEAAAAEEAAGEGDGGVVEEAAEEVAEEAADEEISKEAEYYEVARGLGSLLGEAGITTEDLDKLAEFGSDEEKAEFGEFLAHLAIEQYGDEA